MGKRFGPWTRIVGPEMISVRFVSIALVQTIVIEGSVISWINNASKRIYAGDMKGQHEIWWLLSLPKMAA
jgi:hypothetical protein